MRSCGPCNACCTTHQIDEVKTLPGSTCFHCSSKGCGIYESRPDGCRQFSCEWLKEKTPEEYRPDKLGLVLDGISMSVGKERVHIIRIWEFREGMLESEECLQITESLLEQGYIVQHRKPIGLGAIDEKVYCPTNLFLSEDAERVFIHTLLFTEDLEIRITSSA